MYPRMTWDIKKNFNSLRILYKNLRFLKHIFNFNERQKLIPGITTAVRLIFYNFVKLRKK